MSELFELSRKYAEQKLELNRTKEAIREFAKQEGYEESAYIGDPVHFEVAGMRFTPIRVTGCAASQSLPPESEGEEVETVFESNFSVSAAELQAAYQAPNGSDQQD